MVNKLIVLNGVPIGFGFMLRVLQKKKMQFLMSSYIFFFQVCTKAKTSFGSCFFLIIH